MGYVLVYFAEQPIGSLSIMMPVNLLVSKVHLVGVHFSPSQTLYPAKSNTFIMKRELDAIAFSSGFNLHH